MKPVRLGVLVVVLLASIGAAAVAAKPLLSAHGEFWTHMYIGPYRFDIQVAFNMQSRGGDTSADHGNLSMRYFDVDNGKLAAVVVSTRIYNIYASAQGGVEFSVDFGVPMGADRLPGFRTFAFRVNDGDTEDEFWMTSPIWYPFVIDRGQIVIH